MYSTNKLKNRCNNIYSSTKNTHSQSHLTALPQQAWQKNNGKQKRPLFNERLEKKLQAKGIITFFYPLSF